MAIIKNKTESADIATLLLLFLLSIIIIMILL